MGQEHSSNVQDGDILLQTMFPHQFLVDPLHMDQLLYCRHYPVQDYSLLHATAANVAAKDAADKVKLLVQRYGAQIDAFKVSKTISSLRMS